MTAKTPVFQLEYLVQGEPARNVRQVLERNSKAVEAALLQGAASPPGAADLLQVAGRVTQLEAERARAWVSVLPAGTPSPPAGVPVYNTGWQNLGGSYGDLRFRLEGTDVLRLEGVPASSQLGVIFTLPTGYRPLLKAKPFPVVMGHSGSPVNGLAAGWAEVRTNGEVAVMTPGTSYMIVNTTVALT